MRYQCGISGAAWQDRAIWRDGIKLEGIAMAGRTVFLACIAAYFTFISGAVFAQDVPGIEICTVEKTMERRTSCLQSNVDFLMKTITKLSADYQRRIDAATRQIEGMKVSVASLEKLVEEQKKAIEDVRKASTPPAKEAAPPAKEGAK
jgi:hypothetical protein